MAARGKTIAVVDDDARVLESMAELLESAGYTVRLYSTGEALLNSSELATLHCLITDIGMPAIDGIELCRRARMTMRGLPTIFMTASHKRHNQQRADAEGHHGLFHKPFDAEEFLAAVDRAVSSD